jgi:hypothetical protein
MASRVRHSKQRLASKQLVQSVDTLSTTDTQPAGTWLNPAPTIIVKQFLTIFSYSYLFSFRKIKLNNLDLRQVVFLWTK